MTDLISRAEAISAICEDGTKLEREGRYILLMASRKQRDADILSALPTVDAVPVVRCKDCKHHHYSVCEIPYCDRIDYGYGWKDEDFCSRGERKDGEHHES